MGWFKRTEYQGRANKPVFTVYHKATTAEVKAGHVILPAASGVQYKILHATMQAIGGSATTSTSVDLKDTDEVSIIACPVTLLTQDEIVDSGASATIVASDISGAVASGKGVMIQDTAKNTLTVATHISVVVEYTIV